MRKVAFTVLLLLAPVLAQAQSQTSGSLANQRAKEFVDQFWFEWSSANSVALPYLQSVIDERIISYGKLVSREQYMKVQMALAKRWPSRQYVLQAGTEQIKCDQSSAKCFVKGIVSWHNSSTARNSTSSGSANFNFTLRETADHRSPSYVVAELSSSVIKRSLIQRAANSPVKSDASVNGNFASSPSDTGSPIFAETIPYVGCSGEDMNGPIVAPTGDSVSVTIPEKMAKMLTYYVNADDQHVLAPRGWHCESSSGADGGRLCVVQRAQELAIGAKILGPAVCYQFIGGGIFPQELYAGYAARLFPNISSGLVREKIDLETKGRDFKPFGGSYIFPRYRSDTYVYRGEYALEYLTNSDRIGLGTQSFCKSELPIYGVLSLTDTSKDDPGVTLLAIRLPKKLDFLKSAIIEDFETEMNIPSSPP